MMKYIIFILLITVISFFEIKALVNKKRFKELTVYILFTVFTFLFGMFYIYNPYSKSLSSIILEIIGIKY